MKSGWDGMRSEDVMRSDGLTPEGGGDTYGAPGRSPVLTAASVAHDVSRLGSGAAAAALVERYARQEVLKALEEARRAHVR
jgi:hypothetical protein